MCGTSNILWHNNLLPRKNQWETFTNILATFMKCCGRLKHVWSPCGKSGVFWNRNRTAQAVLSQLLVLKCCRVITSFVRIDASQLNKWRSVFQSAKEVLGTSFLVLDVQRCVRDVFLRASQSWRSISSELLARFEAEGKNFLSRIATADETWFHHFESETKRQSMEWHRLPLPGRKNKKIQIPPSVSKVMITVLWDSEE